MERRVCLNGALAAGEMCAVEYCKRHGEHLLATKIVKYRKGEMPKDNFIQELALLCTVNDDILMERMRQEA